MSHVFRGLLGCRAYDLQSLAAEAAPIKFTVLDSLVSRFEPIGLVWILVMTP